MSDWMFGEFFCYVFYVGLKLIFSFLGEGVSYYWFGNGFWCFFWNFEGKVCCGRMGGCWCWDLMFVVCFGWGGGSEEEMGVFFWGEIYFCFWFN